jgi:hypothetical protein
MLNSALGTASPSTPSSLSHRRILRHLVNQVESKPNLSHVLASLPNWSGGKPEPISGHIPDLSAFELDNGRKRKAIWAMVTWQSLTAPPTRPRLQAFSAWKEKEEGAFYLALPASIEPFVWSWINIHNIHVTGFWIIDD